jgi:hypothetical protein
MRFTINVDCTPEEARAFLGLPDVAPMQKEMMELVRKKMEESVRAMEPEAMLKVWLPASLEGFEQLQKMFWGQMGSGSATEKK